MHILFAAVLTCVFAYVPPLLAQSCAGGVDGGMDATGSQCTVSADAMPQVEQAPGTAEALLQRGLAEYEIGHYAAAARHFRDAAGRGNRRAAEILTLMYRYGERLYGSQVRADAAESARWSAVAANARAKSITQATAPLR